MRIKVTDKITPKFLRKWVACIEGYDWFMETYGKGPYPSLEELMEEIAGNYYLKGSGGRGLAINWLMSRWFRSLSNKGREEQSAYIWTTCLGNRSFLGHVFKETTYQNIFALKVVYRCASHEGAFSKVEKLKNQRPGLYLS